MEKRILLIDVDCKYPNIALMKLSGYYKSKGYNIDFKKLNYDFFNQRKKQKRRTVINAKDYEKVFVSMIFNSNRFKVSIINCFDVEYGGTGYNIEKKLPKEIDDFKEDYSIYPGVIVSYGFITRGCIRNCSFCFVPRKEGMIHKYREIDDIFRKDLGHVKVRFYDNNVLAHPDWKAILQELIDKKIKCAFSQGLDIRLLTKENAPMLREIKYISEYYFAFDDIRLMPIIKEKMKLLKKHFRPWTCRFYIYCHPDMDFEKNIMKRINYLRENKCLAYLMRDIKCLTSKDIKKYSQLQRWCHSPQLFTTCTFNEFINKRTSKFNSFIHI